MQDAVGGRRPAGHRFRGGSQLLTLASLRGLDTVKGTIKLLPGFRLALAARVFHAT